MPFAFTTSALRLPELYSTLRPKSEAQDGAMLHAVIINFWRGIVNQTRGLSAAPAAQFNQAVQRMSAAGFGEDSDVLGALIADLYR